LVRDTDACEMRVNDEPLNASNIWQLENADEIAHVFAKQGIPLRRTSMTIAEILQQAKTLSGQERKELVKSLVDSLEMSEAAPCQQRRLSELRGLGKEIWEDIDAQEHVNQLRSEWDERPQN
jgi:hypothetical protein